VINLYQWQSGKKLPNSGPFCMKLESYLRLTGLEHKVISTNNMAKSPKKTMPFVEINGKYISDSQIIIAMLEKQSSKPLDGHLSAEQRAQATAYRALVEARIVPALIYSRWLPDTSYQQFSRLIFAGAPALIRVLIGAKLRKGVRKSLYANGIARHSDEEILAFAKEDINAIAQFLGEKKFAFGDQVSTLDLSIFSVTANILHGDVDIPLVELVKAHPNLVSHASRVMKLAYGREF
jgi:glutathione S-transferase